MSAVAAHFPGTTTLKYNGPTGAERAVGTIPVKEKKLSRNEFKVKLTDDQKLKPPSTGWESAKCYYTVNPVRVSKCVVQVKLTIPCISICRRLRRKRSRSSCR